MVISKIAENTGVTLLELIIGMAILAVVTAAGYNLYLNQKKASQIQEQLVEMHQNLRAAMFYLEDELKTAGCDPDNTGTPGFLQANTTILQFTRDIAGGTDWFDGDIDDADENITYSCFDSDGDGSTDLARYEAIAASWEIVASNIEVLNFVYLDGSGTVLSSLPLSTTDMASIQSVQVTMVARSRQQDPDYTNTDSFDNLQGTEILTAQNDHYYRRALSVTVTCRNM